MLSRVETTGKKGSAIECGEAQEMQSSHDNLGSVRGDILQLQTDPKRGA